MVRSALWLVVVIFLQVNCHSVFSQGDQWEQGCSQLCGGGVQKMKGNANKTRTCNAFDCQGEAGCVTVHYTFDTMTSEKRIYDTSNNGNHGNAIGDVSISDAGQFGKCFHVPKHTNISIGSATFHNKPRLAITVASWVKLTSLAGSREIFHTCNSERGQNQGQGQYHFEINDGKVRWFHRDHMARIVFNVQSESSIAAETWVHVVGTYRRRTREAKIYINGVLAPLSSKSEQFKIGKAAKIDGLSSDWACANIGAFQNKRALDGFIDDFFIFKCELFEFEIRELFEKGSFKRHIIPAPLA